MHVRRKHGDRPGAISKGAYQVNTLTKVAVGMLSILGLIFVVGSFVLPIFVDCEVVTLRSATASSGQTQAKIEAHTCRDSADSGTYLIIGAPSSRSRSIVRIYDNSTTDFDLHWRNDRELEIFYPIQLQLFEEPTMVGDVKTRFRSR